MSQLSFELDRPLALTMPLNGAHMIEASAGTGKTYTLAALYVRLVLGHGRAKPLLPQDILVVTFTKAATEELRHRIRQRLIEAANAFRQGDTSEADPFLKTLVDDYPENQHLQCADQLALASQWMDAAAIYTIHSFSQRMLGQHAFDSGSSFELNLQPNDADLLQQACEDYWRQQCLTLPEPLAAKLAEQIATPAQLQRQLQPILSQPSLALGVDKDSRPLSDHLNSITQQTLDTLAQIKFQWRDWSTELLHLFEQAWEQGHLPTKSPRKSDVTKWFNGILDWSNSDGDALIKLTATFLNHMEPNNLQSKGENLDAIHQHPGIQALPALNTLREQLPSPHEATLIHAYYWVCNRLADLKSELEQLNFDDLLLHLNRALKSESGAALASRILSQHPVALIDEFQDTDPLQYDTFERIYQRACSAVIADNALEQSETDINPVHAPAWLMIGDPKQAIYSFRGADIYTYLRARQTHKGSLHALETNYRSSVEMVKATNAFFNQAAHMPTGAFMHGDEIPFTHVDAHGTSSRFMVDNHPHSALTCWLLTNESDPTLNIKSGEYVNQFAQRCASAICDLLNKGQKNLAGFQSNDDFRPVSTADIAILVRNGTEANLIKQALAERQIQSVYLSQRENVFQSAEAHEIALWLNACAHPHQEHAIRSALACESFNLSFDHIDALQHDGLLWQHYSDQFHHYHGLWLSKGVLPMLRRLLHDFKVAHNLLNTEQGERQLTNFLHLAELLHIASIEHDSPQALTHYLAQQRVDDKPSSDETQLRLESDDALVKIITIHKSKGLEFPLVFLPFICGFSEVNKKAPLFLPNSDGTKTLVLNPNQEQLNQAQQENLAEDLRLLYVAITRARHACWLGLAPLSKGNIKRIQLEKSAIGYVLDWQSHLDANALSDKLNALANNCDSIRVSPAPSISDVTYDAPEQDDIVNDPPVYHRQPQPSWWIASYSALSTTSDAESVNDSAQVHRLSESIVEENVIQADPVGSVDNDAIVESMLPQHQFIRGAVAGNFLHQLLEEMGEAGFGDYNDPDLRDVLLEKPLTVRNWQQWQPGLKAWLKDIINAPLPTHDNDVTLAELSPKHCRVEPEFFIEANHVNSRELDKLIQKHILPNQPRPELTEKQLNGMLKGFIDLLFEHEGRFYILDYKSNWLGPNDDSYHPQALDEAILAKRYDVQYCLYLLATHRLLRYRLGQDYDYELHIGGAIYLFLRGIDHESSGCHFQRPPIEFIDALDRLFQGQKITEALA